MYAKDYMRHDPFTVTVDDPLSTAIDQMVSKHQADLWVVDGAFRFVGEIRALQFAKLLVPVTVGSQYELESTITNDESVAESLEEAQQRLEPFLDRKVKDFVDHQVPVVRPDLPIASALMLLRGGMIRVPIVEAGSNRLLGTFSMLTMLERLRAS
jgi:CBS domain-containing protein